MTALREKLEEQLRQRPVTARILLYGVAVQVLFIVLHGINKELLGDGNFLALDKDASLPTWFTVVLFAVAGISAALLAALRPKARLPLLGLAAYGFVFSLEQTTQIHTQLEDHIGDPIATLGEMAVGLLLVVVVVSVARMMEAPFKQLLWLSILTILISTGSSEMNSAFDLPYAGVIFFQTLEEVTEMLTATLFIAATVEPLLLATGISVPRPRHAPAAETPLPAR